MKRLLLYSIYLIALFLTACSKKSDQVELPHTVTINGIQYPTIAIGNQTWTSANYNGPGGVNYNDTTINDPLYGKLYTIGEAKAVILPRGWRLPAKNDWNNLFYTMIGRTYPNDGFATPTNSLVPDMMLDSTWEMIKSSKPNGFNAVPAGTYTGWFFPSQRFFGKGQFAVFLNSSFDPGPDAGNFYIQDIKGAVNAVWGQYVMSPTDRGSVRFVKDN